MFSKKFFLAVLSLSLATSSLAIPADNFRGGKNNQAAQCSTAVATVTVTASAAAATQTNAAATTGGKGGVNNAAGGKSNNNATGGKGGSKGGAAGNNNAASSSAAAAAATSAATGGNNAAGGAGAGGDIQKSLTLAQSVIATGFADNGNTPPSEGQASSLTSTNNFINFCATTGKPITNGLQIKTGSCNPAPMGIIAATTNMPSCKFVTPTNFDVIKSNTAFTVKLAVNHLQLGSFTNASSTYYAAPQQINGQGDIIGHTHVTIEKLTSLQQTTPNDPNVFAFFKGVNTAADSDGTVSVDVTDGLPAGTYKLSTINSAMNHQPVLVAVAQHAALDDAVYFAITDDGKPPAEFAQILGGAGSAAAGNGNGNAAAAAASSSAAPAASSSAAATKGGNKFGGFKGGKQGGKRRAVF